MKVTVCIPVYNVEKYIRRCLESVVNQTYNNLEIIVVNDCTPDNSMCIVNVYAQMDSRIRIISHDKNLGLMMARRTAYMAATGDYITFCDSDDALDANAIKILVDIAEKEDADIISANHIYIDVNNHQKVFASYLKYGYDKVSIYKSLLKKELFHNLWAKLYKRSLLQEKDYTTFHNFTNGEDACLFYQIVNNLGKMVHVNRPLYYYYQNLASSTHVRLSEDALRSIVIVNKMRSDICGNYPELRRYTNRYIFLLYNELKSEGYDDDSKLSKLFNEYDLMSYAYFSKSWYYLTFKDYLKLFVKGLFKQ